MASLQEDFNKAKLQADFNQAKQSHAYTGITRGGEKSDKYSDNKFASGLAGFLNLPGDTLKTVVGAADALTYNLPETLTGLAGTAAGGIQKAANYMGFDAGKQFYPEAESAYDTVIGPYTDEERFWKMVAENPAKPAGDLAALLSGGAGLAGMAGKADLASGLNKVASFADPVSLGTKVVKGAAGLIPESWPRGIMKNALKVPAKKGLKGEQRIVENMLKREMGANPADLAKAKAESFGAGGKVKGIVDYATEGGMEIPTAETLMPVRDTIKRFKKPLRTSGEDLTGIGESLRKINKRAGREMTPSQVLEAKQGISDIGGAAFKAGEPTTAVHKAFDKAHASGLRKSLVDRLPIDVLLKKQSELIELGEVIEEALIRSGNMGITQGSGGAGYIAGRAAGSPVVGMGASAAKSIFDRPGVKSATANVAESMRTNYGTSKAYHSARELNRANEIGKAQDGSKLDTLDKLLNLFKSDRKQKRPADRNFNIGAAF